MADTKFKTKGWPPKGYRTPTKKEYRAGKDIPATREERAFEYQKSRGMLRSGNTKPLSEGGWADAYPNKEYPRPQMDRDPNWRPGDFHRKEAEAEAKRIAAIRAKYKGEAERRYQMRKRGINTPLKKSIIEKTTKKEESRPRYGYRAKSNKPKYGYGAEK
jgi:hypothetical protein